jgi:hypothetical protein
VVTADGVAVVAADMECTVDAVAVVDTAADAVAVGN